MAFLLLRERRSQLQDQNHGLEEKLATLEGRMAESEVSGRQYSKHQIAKMYVSTFPLPMRPGGLGDCQ
jgi:hypothetical protein